MVITNFQDSDLQSGPELVVDAVLDILPDGSVTVNTYDIQSLSSSKASDATIQISFNVLVAATKAESSITALTNQTRLESSLSGSFGRAVTVQSLQISREVTKSSDGGTSKDNTPIIAGAVGGGAAAMILAASFVVVKRRKSKTIKTRVPQLDEQFGRRFEDVAIVDTSGGQKTSQVNPYAENIEDGENDEGETARQLALRFAIDPTRKMDGLKDRQGSSYAISYFADPGTVREDKFLEEAMAEQDEMVGPSASRTNFIP